MDIVNITFEEKLIFQIKDQIVTVFSRQGSQHGDIAFGISAPRAIHVDREEIYRQKKFKNNK
ncbi:carbon storage regulator [Tatlockia micdadei]|uniref:carbon storage regulator n=1 Tax=Legionella micdadei TaxID=451 RepID=UPI00156F1CB0|nr:carbon storage regulator [Legionella micdadei]NSL19591.1 carbon storage regulator [Legionella micdadei]